MSKTLRLLNKMSSHLLCMLFSFLLLLLMLPCTLLDTPQQRDAAAINTACFYTNDVHNAEQSSSTWCCDTGTNRFVTNDLADFVPNSIKIVSVPVTVGSGTITATKTGTVHLQTGTGHHIVAKDCLYLPSCSKKLIPASPLIKRGLTLTISPATTDIAERATYTSSSGEVVLEGKLNGGLYLFDCQTTVCGEEAANALFGLTASTTRAEFPKRLLEAHWAYGHLHFYKLRKLLGLKRWPNPYCPTCSLAKSRIDRSNPYYRPRATHANQRIHVDVGFTKNNTYCSACMLHK